MSLKACMKKFFMITHKQHNLDKLYLDIAERLSQESHSMRSKVGAILVKDNSIIAEGWNGTPSGWDNECEEWQPAMDYADGTFITKKEVLHAESNALMKVARSTNSSEDSTLYTTLSPCYDCAKLIVQSGIKRVVYKNEYRDLSPLLFLTLCDVECEKFDYEREIPVGGEIPPKNDWRYNTQ